MCANPVKDSVEFWVLSFKLRTKNHFEKIIFKTFTQHSTPKTQNCLSVLGLYGELLKFLAFRIAS